MDSSSAWGVFPHADQRVPTGRGYVVREMQSGHVTDQHNYGGLEPVATFSHRARAAAERFADKLTKDPTASRFKSKQPDWVTQDPDFHQLKVIRSHTGLAAFMLELDRDPTDKDMARLAGWIRQPSHIPTPYAYGVAKPVFAWGEHFVWIPETSHKVYRVFSVNPRLVRNTEAQVWEKK